MRKFKIFILPFVLVFLCACSASSVTPVTEGISFNAHIFYYNKEYTCAVIIQNNGDTVLTLTEPQLISGAKVVVTKDGAYAEYQDIKYPVNISRAEGAPYFLLGVLDDIKTKSAKKTDSGYAIEGNWAEQKYKITLAESGIPLTLTGENIEIEFLDAKIIG